MHNHLSRLGHPKSPVICPQHGDLEPFMKNETDNVFSLAASYKDLFQPVTGLSQWGVRDLKIHPRYGDSAASVQIADEVSILMQGYSDEKIAFIDGKRPLRLFLILSEDQSIDPEFIDRFIDDSDENMPGKIAALRVKFNMIEISNWPEEMNKAMRMLPETNETSMAQAFESGLRIKAIQGNENSDAKGYSNAFEFNDENYNDPQSWMAKCVIAMFLIRLVMQHLHQNLRGRHPASHGVHESIRTTLPQLDFPTKL